MSCRSWQWSPVAMWKRPPTLANGVGVNSANDEVSLNGLETPEAKEKITEWLEAKASARGRSTTAA